MLASLLAGARGPGECAQLAAENKALLAYLRASGADPAALEAEEARFRAFLAGLAEVSAALEGVEHAFIKLRRPFPYVPSDLDVLVPAGQAERAASRLEALGLRAVVREPYCLTLAGRGLVVDLYAHPTLAGVVYADGGRLLEHAERASVWGVEVEALSEGAEAVLAAAHAVYKEGIVTLNDAAAVAMWLGRGGWGLAEELKCSGAVRYALSALARALTGGSLPLRVPPPDWAALWASKLREDPLSRSTLLNAARAVASERAGRLALWRLTRRSY